MLQLQRIYAWLVHLFTSLGAVFGILAIIFAIEAAKADVLGDIGNYHYNIKLSMYAIIVAVFIDAIDGSLARLVDIKKLAAGQASDSSVHCSAVECSTVKYGTANCSAIYCSEVQ